jgi:hypothetical protein
MLAKKDELQYGLKLTSIKKVNIRTTINNKVNGLFIIQNKRLKTLQQLTALSCAGKAQHSMVECDINSVEK